MQRYDLIKGILFVLGGCLLLGIGLLTDNALDSLLIGFAAGAIVPGIVMIGRYFYWNMPANKERYREKMENEQIELHDELKTKLRDQSGRYSYMIGIITVSASIVLFSILGKLGIISDPRTIILYLTAYLIFQIGIGIVLFRRLLKKYT